MPHKESRARETCTAFRRDAHDARNRSRCLLHRRRIDQGCVWLGHFRPDNLGQGREHPRQRALTDSIAKVQEGITHLVRHDRVQGGDHLGLLDHRRGLRARQHRHGAGQDPGHHGQCKDIQGRTKDVVHQASRLPGDCVPEPSTKDRCQRLPEECRKQDGTNQDHCSHHSLTDASGDHIGQQEGCKQSTAQKSGKGQQPGDKSLAPTSPGEYDDCTDQDPVDKIH